MDERTISACQLSGESFSAEQQQLCLLLLDSKCRSLALLYGYGFFITFGALLVKLWRVEKIFNNPSLRRIKITTQQLMGFIVALVLMCTTII